MKLAKKKEDNFIANRKFTSWFNIKFFFTDYVIIIELYMKWGPIDRLKGK
jgi:hypothetical protein